MDVSLNIENDTQLFCSGDVVMGIANISCAQKTTIAELTVALIGESTSSLTGSSGLLFSRRERETHVIVHEVHRIVPPCTPQPQKLRSIQLDAGSHRFQFRLRIPRAPDYSPCPPNTPLDNINYDEKLQRPRSLQQLPPSTTDLQAGNGITYRLEVVTTTVRNMFKTRALKSFPIIIWPSDRLLLQRDRDSTLGASVVTARATILGPSSLPLPSRDHPEEILGLGPAKILITASLQPDFQLTKLPGISAPSVRNRGIIMGLSITKVNQHPQDLYLQSFQMLLVGYTDIRAGTASHGHMSFWTLQSLSNVGLQTFSGSDPSGTQREIDTKLWDDVVLDESVVPDFETRNLGRRYELEVLMGWQCRSGEHIGRVFFVQVRIPVRISSAMRSCDQTGDRSGFSNPDEASNAATGCKDSSSVETREAYSGSNAPPTYDEAVRVLSVHGGKDFNSH